MLRTDTHFAYRLTDHSALDRYIFAYRLTYDSVMDRHTFVYRLTDQRVMDRHTLCLQTDIQQCYGQTYLFTE